METGRLQTTLVRGPVEYRAFVPAGASGAEPVPLVLLLHGGGGSASFLERVQPLLDDAIQRGLLPPVVAATPSAGRSFYLDYRDGSQRWETFLLEEFLPEMRRRYPVRPEAASTFLMGVSMGGMGCLRLAFKHPERFRAVAALEPGIEPALRFADIALRDRIYREPAVYEERFGRPVDEAYWQANNPANLARRNAAAIAGSGLAIYLECGDADGFFLHYGAEFLHRVLFDAGVSHEYRLVRGGDHLGGSLGPRFLDAFGFLGRIIDPPPADVPGGETTLAQFHQMVAGLKRRAGYVDARTRLVRAGEAEIQVTIRGEGEPVVLLPSLGRGTEDFDHLARCLALAGYAAVLPQPRGIGGSRGPLHDLTLHHLAADVAAVIEDVGAPAVVVGHAFGNRVARCVAADRPEIVSRVVLLASGGAVRPPREVLAALHRCLDLQLPDDVRLKAVREAFFAGDGDPAVWRDGWYPELARAQRGANAATPLEEWWDAGRAPLLVVQGADDAIAPVENGRLLREQHGERVDLVEIPDAGHALLPEQPEAIAHALLSHLSKDI